MNNWNEKKYKEIITYAYGSNIHNVAALISLYGPIIISSADIFNVW